MPLFDETVIVGPGLIGGSLGLALKARGLSRRVIGVGRRQTSLERALAMGAVDEVSLDAPASVGRADLVVLATSVGLAPKQAAELLPRMRPEAVLTDVGSVKVPIRDAIAECLDGAASGPCFVGGHPIAGSEQRGVDAARVDLFQGAVCLLTPDVRTDPDERALSAVREMWKGVGGRVIEMSAERHDRLLAEISHLPHIVASCLMNAASDEALEVAGRGFLDATRIASGDADLWKDICLANKEELSRALGLLGGALRELSDAIARNDAVAVRDLLDRARRRRDARLDAPS
jgi:prephenate dehydrogenase